MPHNSKVGQVRQYGSFEKFQFSMSGYKLLKTPICWLAFLQTKLLCLQKNKVQSPGLHLEQLNRFQFYINPIYMQVNIIFSSSNMD